MSLADSGGSELSIETAPVPRVILERDPAEVRLFPRDYAHVNYGYPEERFNLTNTEVVFQQEPRYELYNCIGSGAYGEVFRALDRHTGEIVVAKTLRSANGHKKSQEEDLNKIRREVAMLRMVAQGPHMIQLLGQAIDPTTELKMLMFEFVENPDYKSVFLGMSEYETRYYLLCLLQAIHYTHSLGIMHRDIKPRNVLYDPSTKKLRLIDWGFGEFYFPGEAHYKWPGTRNYKAPELILHYEFYDYAVDMWAFGCILGALLLGSTVLFPGRKDREERHFRLQEIANLIGSDGLFDYLRKYRMTSSEKLKRLIVAAQPVTNWKKRRDDKVAAKFSLDGVDLLTKLLRWDPQERLTAAEALAHPYFEIFTAGKDYLSPSFVPEYGGEEYSYESPTEDYESDDEDQQGSEWGRGSGNSGGGGEGGGEGGGGEGGGTREQVSARVAAGTGGRSVSSPAKAKGKATLGLPSPSSRVMSMDDNTRNAAAAQVLGIVRGGEDIDD